MDRCYPPHRARQAGFFISGPDRSTTQQPEALRLADSLERPGYGWHSTPAQCAAELRRLHAELETLRADVEHKDKYAEQLERELEDAKFAGIRKAERAHGIT